MLGGLLAAPPQGAFGNHVPRTSAARVAADHAFCDKYGALLGSSAADDDEGGAVGEALRAAAAVEGEGEAPDPDAPMGDALGGFGDVARRDLFFTRTAAVGQRLARGFSAPCVTCSATGTSTIACVQCGSHCPVCDTRAHASCYVHERTVYSRSPTLAASVSVSRLTAGSVFSCPFAAVLGPNERVRSVGGAEGGAAAGAGGISGVGAETLVSVVLPYPFEPVTCPTPSCSGVLTPSGPFMAAQGVVYGVKTAAFVSRQARGTCSLCSASRALHPVLHLDIDYRVGSLTAPGQVFTNDFLDMYRSSRSVKESFGIHTLVNLWIAQTQPLRESGVPLPPPPRPATLRVAALEADFSYILSAKEAGSFTDCPSCGEVARGGAVDGEYKCDNHNGEREGSSGYADAAHNSVANAAWVHRASVLSAEAAHPAGSSVNERSCGGASAEGVHLSTRRGQKSSTGFIATVCFHLFPIVYSDLARGERFSQLAAHVVHWRRLLERQRLPRALAMSLVAHVAPLRSAVVAGDQNVDVFAAACAFLRSRDFTVVAPLTAPPRAADVAWVAPVVAFGDGNAAAAPVAAAAAETTGAGAAPASVEPA